MEVLPQIEIFALGGCILFGAAPKLEVLGSCLGELALDIAAVLRVTSLGARRLQWGVKMNSTYRTLVSNCVPGPCIANCAGPNCAEVFLFVFIKKPHNEKRGQLSAVVYFLPIE